MSAQNPSQNVLKAAELWNRIKRMKYENSTHQKKMLTYR